MLVSFVNFPQIGSVVVNSIEEGKKLIREKGMEAIISQNGKVLCSYNIFGGFVKTY